MARLLLRDLTPATAYKVQLRAVGGDSVSPWSRLFDMPTTADTTPPDVPAWASAGTEWVVNGDTFVATWVALNFTLDQNKDFDHYELELGNGTTTTVIRTTNTSYTLTFDQNRILFTTPAATVTARVRAVDALGNASGWSSLKSATNPPPSPVNSITTTALLEAIDVKWDGGTLPDDFKQYVLQLSTTSSSSGFSTVYVGPNPQYTHSTIMFATDHYFRVYIQDKFGTLSTAVTSGAVRPKTAFGSDTTPPDNATAFAGTSTFDTTNQQSYVNFTWTASATPSDVEKYEIRYSLDGTNWNYLTVPGDQTAFRLNDVIPGSSVYAAIRAVDPAGNKSVGWLNTTIYPITAAADTTNPPTPFAPSVVSNTMQIQVSHSGKDSLTGNMPPDVAFYEVYASTTTGFTPAASNMLGTIAQGPTLTNTFDVPTTGSGTTQTWFVKVIAVDRSGNKSAASAQTTATPGLITNANIADATIQTAKIVNLNADKIVAGNGFVNDLIVKSKLTLGDASSTGIIESYDYTTSAGATGFQFSKTGLIIKTGNIEAAALKIQNGVNIMPPYYASFETHPDNYVGNFTCDIGGVLGGINTTNGKFGPQKAGFVWNSQASNIRIWFAPTATSYNVPVEAGKTYIFSMYSYVSGAGATGANSTIYVRYNDVSNTITTLNSSSYTNNADSPLSALRQWGSFTVPAGVTAVQFAWGTTTQNVAMGVSFDGLQLEEKIGNLTTPSAYKDPSFTRIDGGFIRTGSITSNTAAKDYNGADMSGLPSWSISTSGAAQFGDVLVRGRMIMGVTGDLENSTTLVTNADGSQSVQEDITKMSGIGTMQSYNYNPGISGWSIRSNGYAEFLQLKANSVSADAISAVSVDKLQPGTVTADLIMGANFRAIDNEILYVTQKSRVGTTATLTLSNSHTRQIGDTINVTMDTADVAFDTPGNTTTTITAITDTTISYKSPSGTGTIGATSATGTIAVTGRSVRMSPDGITLLQNDGTSPIIDLPTNTLNPAYFAGAIDANSLSIDDNFLLQGTNNLISPGGALALAANITTPSSKPVATFSWDNVKSWVSASYSAWKSGLLYDAGRYLTTNAFYGGALFGINPDGSYNCNVGISTTPSAANPYGVIKANDGKFYVLVNDSADGLWKVRRYAATGTGVSTYEAQWTYDRASVFGVTAAQWKVDGFNGSALKDPTIGYGTPDGTNYYIYLARPKANGVIVVSRYSTAGVWNADATTNITDNQHLKSINVGTFDFGSGQYRWVITTGGGAIAATNYVTNTAGVHQPNETWGSPGGQKLWGTCWNGSQWVSFGQNHYLYWYSTVAMNGTNVYYVRNSWFDGNNSRTTNVSAVSGNGTTTTITTSAAHGLAVGDIVYPSGTLAGSLINGVYLTVATVPTSTTFTASTAYSGSVAAGGTITNEWETFMSGASTAAPVTATGATKITVTRRAKMTLNAGGVPPMPAPNAPDRAVFYISNATNGAGSYYRQDNPSPSGALTWPIPSGNAAPVFSGNSSTRTPFPDSTPSKITFGANGFIDGSGDFQLGSFKGSDARGINGTGSALNFVIGGIRIIIDGVSTTSTTAAEWTGTAVYPTPFASPARVVISGSSNGSPGIVWNAYGPTATGFSWRSAWNDNTTHSNGGSAYYIAIGPA